MIIRSISSMKLFVVLSSIRIILQMTANNNKFCILRLFGIDFDIINTRWLHQSLRQRVLAMRVKFFLFLDGYFELIITIIKCLCNLKVNFII